jgi:hypothetical protein
LLCRALLFLGALAAISLWLSALPLPIRISLAIFALGYSHFLARRESGRRNFSLVWTSDGTGLEMRFADCSLHLSAPIVTIRGPLACVSGQGDDGRFHRLLWCPDTLPSNSRRTLRLLGGGTKVASPGPALATMSG